MNLHQQLNEYRQALDDFQNPETLDQLEATLEDCQLVETACANVSGYPSQMSAAVAKQARSLFAPLGDLRSKYLRDRFEKELLIESINIFYSTSKSGAPKRYFDTCIRFSNLLSIPGQNIIDAVLPFEQSEESLLMNHKHLLMTTKSLAAADNTDTLSPGSKKQMQKHVCRAIGRITAIYPFQDFLKDIPCVDSESSSTE
jgi:hypothetical protein